MCTAEPLYRESRITNDGLVPVRAIEVVVGGLGRLPFDFRRMCLVGGVCEDNADLNISVQNVVLQIH